MAHELTEQEKMRLVLARLRSYLAEAKYLDGGFCTHCKRWTGAGWHSPNCPVQDAYEREALACRYGDIELTLDTLNDWFPPEGVARACT